ncbi:Ceramide-binding protein SVF1 [Nakaseomyces bracarensis]|uniref:Ceramide-binding protein SVF1 n=1 Tax=Nakaseomyces bracarensis TaxID=273131 RepID=A0ABR4NPY9_9SACH
MLRWIQGGISAVTGIAEPEYGKEYIHSVTERVEGKQPFRETTREDFFWQHPDHTNVETVTFYFSNLKTGVLGFAQIIHSNIIGLHTAAQFTFRIFDSRNPENLNLWTSTKLENFRIEDANFYADNLSVELSEDNTQYHLVSNVNEQSIVDLTITRLTPGAKLGDDPATYYGDNLEQPWGAMKHVFWPRNSCVGEIKLKVPKKKTEGDETKENEEEEDVEAEEFEERTLDFNTKDHCYCMFVMAFQGMKPHHAAKAWNFVCFHSEKNTFVLMEYITPKSYSNTKVSVGIITSDKDILGVTYDNNTLHMNQEVDSVGWNVPKYIRVELNGVKSDLKDEEVSEGKEEHKIKAMIEGPLENRIERIDVMGEVPNFVKNIVSGVAGTKPFIYQYADSDNFTLQLEEEEKSKGLAWVEVTFISESDVVTEESYNEE